MSCRERTSCRVCGAGLIGVLDLGTQYLGGQFPGPGDPDPPAFPLELTRCAGCGLVQLRHTVEPGLLFRDYWYRSGVSATMRQHLTALAVEAAALARPREWPSVLDIGGNDLTLLQAMPPGWRRTCVDPSMVSCEAASGSGPAVIGGFYPDALTHTAKFDLIFTIACLYDVDDPVTFARALRRNLTPGGLWCVEVAYLPDMLRQTAYDAICHEHLCYYRLADLQRLADLAGLRVVRSARNGCNGGSLRVYLAREEADYDAGDPVREEVAAGDLERFATAVPESRRQLRSHVDALHEAGQVVHLLGASTKVNTLLQHCGLNHALVRAASDRDPRKVGRRTPGTGIPIVSEEQSRAQRPDVYLVGPWHFREEIVARERAARTTARLLFPLPRLEVV
jgi:SAM-dependent methyltransferase